MRLIDAEHLKRWIMLRWESDVSVGYDDVKTNEILEQIDRELTINPEPQWIPCTPETMPEEDDVYLVYAPDYTGGSSSAKENHKGVMFSKYRNGKWSIEHGYYKRTGCVRAYMPLPAPPYQPKEDES